ncbi:MinD/ParA family protein [Haloferax sp. DFSO60]|uniref:MinD/ParA family ATP-binding protein n=1 Tax=Haloferax sp. DFSO60 TaxID=3388652 RepID=UPI003978943A
MLAIAGGKGGSGKTTTTVGIAQATEGTIVAVDADRDMPNLHSMVGVERDERTFPRVKSHPTEPSISILPAPRGADDEAFERWLRTIAEDEVPAVVDCPAGAGPDAAVPLRVADGVLVVTQLCAPTLRDAAKTAAMARAVGTPVIGVVVSRSRIAPDAIGDLIGAPVLGSVPEGQSPVLSDASVRGAYKEVVAEIRPEGLI